MPDAIRGHPAFSCPPFGSRPGTTHEALLPAACLTNLSSHGLSPFTGQDDRQARGRVSVGCHIRSALPDQRLMDLAVPLDEFGRSNFISHGPAADRLRNLFSKNKEGKRGRLFEGAGHFTPAKAGEGFLSCPGGNTGVVRHDPCPISMKMINLWYLLLIFILQKFQQMIGVKFCSENWAAVHRKSGSNGNERDESNTKRAFFFRRINHSSSRTRKPPTFSF